MSTVIIIAVAVIIIKGIVIVPQSYAYVVEYLGKYNKTLEGGFHIIIPVLDTIRVKLTKEEQMINIPEQNVITRDNVNISVDGIIFVQVEDAKRATYGIVDFKNALANLSTTTLRAEIEEAMNMQMKAEREICAIELKAMGDVQKYELEKVAEGQRKAMLMINS
ncbi:MAG: Protein QmcA [uncultured Sulfurimonas sp.]|nr:MAG: Protein QmcA [uncultured Sulfurimonas sp.]